MPPAPDASTITAVVVSWNGGAKLLDCLRALAAQSRPFDAIVLVDNGSTDGSIEAVRGALPAVSVVALPHNTGFGAGVNRGVTAATTAWVALINNDAIADRDWLTRCLAATATRADIGMVACMVKLDVATGVIDKVGHRLAIDGQNFGRGHRHLDRGQYDAVDSVAWPDGCASLWRRSVFVELGGMDEDFFAYADDADLGIRFRLAGWRCALAPRAVIEHRHSQTLGAYSARKLYLVERNRIWLAAKYFPPGLLAFNAFFWTWRALLTLRAARAGSGSWALVPKLGRMQAARAIARAQFDGWRGLPHQWRKRAQLATQCGADWPRRFEALRREAHVSLAALAAADVS